MAAAGYALLLIAYGNAVSASPESFDERYGWVFILVEYLIAAASVFWAVRVAGLQLEEVGLTRAGARRAAAIGAATGALLILPVALYLLFPFASPGGSIDYEEAPNPGTASFLLWAFVVQPLGTSIPEELLFRGVLHALAVRALSLWRAIAFTAAVFASWHVVVNFRTIQETSAGDSLAAGAVAQAVSIAVLLAGGVAFGVLRHRTGTLAAPIAFHWVVVVVMQAALGAEG